jgi:hypothetical protein
MGSMELSKDVRTVLVEARDLLRTGWTQRAPARDDAGVETSATDARSTCWCVLGAVYAVTMRMERALGLDPFRLFPAGRCDPWATARWRAISSLESHIDVSIVVFNDAPDRTQEQVIDLFDRTIADMPAGPDVTGCR